MVDIKLQAPTFHANSTVLVTRCHRPTLKLWNRDEQFLGQHICLWFRQLGCKNTALIACDCLVIAVQISLCHRESKRMLSTRPLAVEDRNHGLLQAQAHCQATMFRTGGVIPNLDEGRRMDCCMLFFGIKCKTDFVGFHRPLLNPNRKENKKNSQVCNDGASCMIISSLSHAASWAASNGLRR